MHYKVSYTTDVKPTGLPDNAVVEQISMLPLSFETSYSRRIELEKDYGRGGFLEITDTHARGYGQVAALEEKDARKLRDGLSELLGEQSDKGEFPLSLTTEFSDSKIGLAHGVLSPDEIFLEIGSRGPFDQARKVKLSRDERKRLAESLLASL